MGTTTDCKITCDGSNRACNDGMIRCNNDGFDCAVNCMAGTACSGSAIVYGPAAGTLTVRCMGDRACSGVMAVDHTFGVDTTIICGGSQSCTGSVQFNFGSGYSRVACIGNPDSCQGVDFNLPPDAQTLSGAAFLCTGVFCPGSAPAPFRFVTVVTVCGVVECHIVLLVYKFTSLRLSSRVLYRVCIQCGKVVLSGTLGVRWSVVPRFLCFPFISISFAILAFLSLSFSISICTSLHVHYMVICNGHSNVPVPIAPLSAMTPSDPIPPSNSGSNSSPWTPPTSPQYPSAGSAAKPAPLPSYQFNAVNPIPFVPLDPRSGTASVATPPGSRNGGAVIGDAAPMAVVVPRFVTLW